MRTDLAAQAASGYQRHVGARRGVDAVEAEEAHQRPRRAVAELPPELRRTLGNVHLASRGEVEADHQQIVSHGNPHESCHW
ncbi:hypothetical protein ACQPYK_23145 [Streptosporangium sp. CA-135522]|uniref:hypothetical protein n=1 Tax=Streptosporangium sp. CA-135522 TaxID=3240072 RepID=UPI003D8F42C3